LKIPSWDKKSNETLLTEEEFNKLVPVLKKHFVLNNYFESIDKNR
jgi:hypothetical protein